MANRIRVKNFRRGTKNSDRSWIKNPDPDTSFKSRLKNRGRNIDRYVEQAQTGDDKS